MGLRLRAHRSGGPDKGNPERNARPEAVMDLCDLSRAQWRNERACGFRGGAGPPGGDGGIPSKHTHANRDKQDLTFSLQTIINSQLFPLFFPRKF